MLKLQGRVQAVFTEQVENAETPFTRYTYLVEGWGGRMYCDRSKNFSGPEPVQGEMVDLDVAVRAYVKTNGEAGFGLIATRNDAPAQAPAAGARAAAPAGV